MSEREGGRQGGSEEGLDGAVDWAAGAVVGEGEGGRRPAFPFLLYHIFFVLITLLAGGRCGEGALTYAHNLLSWP